MFRKKLKKGTIGWDTPVFTSGLPKWIPAKEVYDLANGLYE
jgi:hypothetical protein